MFNIKSLIIIISLVVITIIQHGFATKCEELMSGYVFDINDEGDINFNTSYNDLTLDMIKEHFDQPHGVEEPLQTTTRLLQGELFQKYVIDLFTNSGINLNGMSSAADWCTQRALDELSPGGMQYSPIFNIQVRTCKTHITNTFQIGENKPPSEIFKLFYENWNIHVLGEDVPSRNQNVIGNNQTVIFNCYGDCSNETPKEINYSRQFFVYYGDKVKLPIETQGSFKTITGFCNEIGNEFVSQKLP